MAVHLAITKKAATGRLFHGAALGSRALLQAIAQDARRHEDQQLSLVVLALGIAEQYADTRNIAQPRHLGDGVLLGDFIDTAKYHRLTVVDQHRSVDFTRVDLRHLAAARYGDELVQRVLLHVDRKIDAVVGRNGR